VHTGARSFAVRPPGYPAAVSLHVAPPVEAEPSVDDQEDRDLSPLLITLKKVAASLQRAKIPFVLGGGFAAYARGGGISGHDVDVMLREQDADAALAALADDGLRIVHPPEDWLVKAYDGDRLVDLIFRPVQRPVTDATLADSEVLPVGGCHLPVLSATALMVHRLLSFSSHVCDYATGLPLARSLREQIEWSRVHRETAESPYARAFLSLARDLRIAPPDPAVEGKDVSP
jgi:putative nucleotidyltransferase-like protein